MRRTRQRDAILRVLQNTECHPTAEWIYAEVRRDLPQISLGTVYRLLNVLGEEGAIRVLRPGDGPKRYDASAGEHHHVVCTGCGYIADVPELIAEGARAEIERWTGFSVSHLRLDWHGLCPGCRSRAADAGP